MNILWPRPFFRNDDVAFDTDITYFREFCETFWQLGLIQTHAVVLKGICNYSFSYYGLPAQYPSRPNLARLDNQTIRELSQPYAIEDNIQLLDFLNASPDEIALHGLYHTNYAAMPQAQQYAEMARGLHILRRLFPKKRIVFFVPPFNKYNNATVAVANRLGLRVLGLEGVHFEEDIEQLNFYPGIWYRYHHHRFYPGSTFDNPRLTLASLKTALAQGMANYCRGRLPMPSFDYEGDTKLLDRLIDKYAPRDPWHRQAVRRRGMSLFHMRALGWIYSHAEYDSGIFEAGCGCGNNLHWLARHGYLNIGGMDNTDECLGVAREVAVANGWQWELRQDDLTNPSNLPAKIDILLALDSTYILPRFDLKAFLLAFLPHLSEHGCIVMDQIDAMLNSYPSGHIHLSQWRLPAEQQTLPSSYYQRISPQQMEETAGQCGLAVIAALPAMERVPRVVYVLARKGVKITARRDLPRLKLPEALLLPTAAAIFQSGEFDAAWYARQYLTDNVNPLEHYVRLGAAEGYDPNPHFKTDAYRRERMELTDPTNPLLHFILARGMERRNDC